MTTEIGEATVRKAKLKLMNVDIPPGALPFAAKRCDVIVEAVLNVASTMADRTSPPAPDKEAAAGWKLVPIEPNEAMAMAAYGHEDCVHAYESMIGAAPPPPSASADTDVGYPHESTTSNGPSAAQEKSDLTDPFLARNDLDVRMDRKRKRADLVAGLEGVTRE